MKPKTILILLIGIIACLCMATQCEKEEPTLPPETQTGANTFGCYVNDELFVPARHVPGHAVITSGLRAGYNPETKQFGIECQARNDSFRDMFFLVDNPQENECLSFSFLEITPSQGYKKTCCVSDDCGSIFFTRFDTINNIASGRFEFSGQCSRYPPYESTRKIQIASGRFDVRFNDNCRPEFIGGQRWVILCD